MAGLIGGNRRHGNPDETGHLVSAASTSGISGHAILPNQAPQRARLSADVYPHNPAEIDVVIAGIIHANGAAGAYAMRTATVVANAGR